MISYGSTVQSCWILNQSGANLNREYEYFQ